MKINANEMLLINKNLKFKGDEAEKTSSGVALAEVPESDDTMNALNAQSMNNIAFQGVNLAALKKMGLSTMVALTMLGGAASMVSCEKDEPEIDVEKPEPTQVIINISTVVNISITMNMTDDELVAAILAEQSRLIALIEQMHKDQQANHEEQMEINKAILAELVKQGISMDRIVALLEQMNMTAEDILKYAIENSEKQDEIINTITQGNEEQKAIMLEILEQIKKGNKISADMNISLTKLIVQMGRANQNDKMMIALLNKILNKINESIQNNKDLSAQEQKLMNAILDAVSSLDDNMKTYFLAIVDKMDSINSDNLDMLASILDAIKESQDKNDANTDKIIDVITEKVNESIQNDKDLSAQEQKLMKAILGALSHLDRDMKVYFLGIINKMDKMNADNIEFLTALLLEIKNLEAQNDANTNKIINAIFQKADECMENNRELSAQEQKLMTAILGALSNIDDNLAKYYLGLINKMDQMNAANIEFLTALLLEVKNLEAQNDANTNKIILAIFQKADECMENNKELSAQEQKLLIDILGKLSKMDNNAKKGILNIISHIDMASFANIKLLNQVLAKMDQNREENNELLNAIISLISESISQNNEMDSKTHQFLQNILTNIDNYNGNVQKLMSLVVSMLSEMNETIKNGFIDMGTKIENASQTNINMLIEVIKEIHNNKGDSEATEILNKIFTLIKDSVMSQKEMNAKFQALLESIIAAISKVDNSIKDGVNNIITNNTEISEKNLEILTKFFQAIEINNNVNNKETNKLLKQIFDLINSGIESGKDMSAKIYQMLSLILDKLSSMSDEMKQNTTEIINSINDASQTNVELFNKIINKVEPGYSNEETNKLLNEMLVLLKQHINDHKDFDSNTQEILENILNNVKNFNNNLTIAIEGFVAKMDQWKEEQKVLFNEVIVNIKDMNKNMQNGFGVVIENMNNMSAENREFYKQVLARLDKMDNNAQNGLALLLEALANGNKISSDILAKIEAIIAKLDTAHSDDVNFHNQAIALLAELSSKIDKLGNKSDSILEAIGNISLDVNVDLSTIEQMLADIKAQIKANGDALMSMDGKLNLVAISLEGIKSQLEEMSGDHKKALAKLDAILNKIPEGCKCKDYTDILNQLLDLVKAIKDDPRNDGKHEGILDDLDKNFD